MTTLVETTVEEAQEAATTPSAEKTLEEIQKLALRLPQWDQLRLISLLTSRMATQVASATMVLPAKRGSEEQRHSPEWERLVAIGEAIAANDDPNLPSITETLLKDRR